MLSLEPESEDRRLFAQIGLAVLMDRGWDRFFGSTRAIAIAKEKVNILVYALGDLRAVVVATDPDLPYASIGEIGELIDASNLLGSNSGRHA